MRALILAAPLALGACALFDSATERAGELVREACTEPRDVRDLTVARINAHAAPHAIALNCATDTR